MPYLISNRKSSALAPIPSSRIVVRFLKGGDLYSSLATEKMANTSKRNTIRLSEDINHLVRVNIQDETNRGEPETEFH